MKDKNEVKSFDSKGDRKTYRKSVVDVTKATVHVGKLTKEETTGWLCQEPPALPDDDLYDYFGFNVEAPLNPIDYSIYKHLRIEMLTNTNDNKLVVNSCQKLIQKDGLVPFHGTHCHGSGSDEIGDGAGDESGGAVE